MDKIRALRYFKRVAELSSFSRAAREFEVPASSVSRRVRDLEQALGVELLERSTRRVGLTELGTVYYGMIIEGLARLDDADALIGQRIDALTGVLRISAMPSYGEEVLFPVLDRFHRAHPALTLDLDYRDELTVLGQDPVDIAIRGGYAPDELVIAKRLDDNEFLLVASPKFVEQLDRPLPLSAEDLEAAPTLQYRGPRGLIPWLVRGAEGWQRLRLRPTMISNNGRILVEAACGHRGLMMVPRWGLHDHFRDRRLVEVPTQHPVGVSTGGGGGIFLLYQRAKYQIPKIRACVDFIVAALAPDTGA